MNNDSTPPPAAALPSQANDNDNDTIDPIQSRQDALTPAQKRVQAQTKKKHEFVGGLMTNLDTLIYMELCIVYYMDCSLFRLLLRVLPQMVFLTPKPSFIPPAPQHRPYIGAIFGSNIICLLLHLFTARPEASEAMRGYLHGGVIIDLVGQKGPTSKIHLLLLDVLVTLLQCFMLAVHVEKERLQVVLKESGPAQSQRAVGTEGQVRVVSAQDHDAEERGVMRDAVTSNTDIELQSLAESAAFDNPSSSAHEPTETALERERLLEEPTSQGEDESPLDIFWSGSATIADFHILENLRVQWRDYGNATGSALQTVGFSAEFAAVAANRRITAATARFQRNMEALNA